MQRRTFLTLAGAGCLGAAQDEPIHALYEKAMVIDALCGPAVIERTPLTRRALEAAAKSGITAINTTVSQDSFTATVDSISEMEALVESEPSRWLIVRQQSDIVRAKNEGKTGVILGFQFTTPFENDLKLLETFRRLGVRVIQLSYNNRSLLADGCLEPADAGLSKLGRNAIARMNELGIAVDLSHCGYRSTAQAIEASKRPVLITHSGCNAVYSHPRNKNDAEIRAMAERGGVMGIYLMPYLVASPKVPDLPDVMAHLNHALKVAGSDHVGIGSDQSIEPVDDSPEQQKMFAADIARRKQLGIGAPGEDRWPYVPALNSPLRMEMIAEGMKKQGHGSSVIVKVLGSNFYRAFGEIWG
jgi:membrane dipeptidase